MRDVFDGYSRFYELQSGLGIAPSMLARRLTSLVDAGLLERRRYQVNPPRDEYVLTPRGQDFHPVVLALFAASNRQLAPPDRSMILIDRQTGAEIDPVLVDRATGQPLDQLDVMFAPGPAASPRIRARLAAVARPFASSTR